MPDVVTADKLTSMGLEFMNMDTEIQERRSFESNFRSFKKFYGSPPSVLACQWYDMCNTDEEDFKLEENEMGEKGLRGLLLAHHFLWSYPKNADLLGSRFRICPKYASGEYLRRWVRRVAALKAKKIVWPENFSEPDSEVFIISVDTADFKTWEVQHQSFPVDRSYCSRKHKHAGLKYEIGVSVFHDQIVWATGPFKPTKSDITIWREGENGEALKTKTPAGKFNITDLGYRTQKGKREMAMIAHPITKDQLELKKFKSLARCRHEGVNGRMKKFKSMFDEFTHGKELHKLCFYAILVTIQYQFDVGNYYMFKV
jgi:hypothetical protein